MSVVRVLNDVITSYGSRSLKNIDHWERELRYQIDNDNALQSAASWKFWRSESIEKDWLNLCSWSGHQREKSILTLDSGAPNAFFLVVLLRRLNDWVPQVRCATRKVLTTVVENSRPQDVVEALFYTLNHWSSWQRIEDEDRNLLRDIAAEVRFLSMIVERLTIATSGPQTLILSQLMARAVMDDSLLAIAQSAVVPSLRAMAFRCLLEKKVRWRTGSSLTVSKNYYHNTIVEPCYESRELSVITPLVELLHLGLKDKSSIVRRVIAQAVIRELDTLGKDAQFFITKLIDDSAPSVRERGQFAQRKLAGETIF